jgi:hypothetical protein
MSTKGTERRREDDETFAWIALSAIIGAAALAAEPGYVAGAFVGAFFSALAIAMLGREGMDLRTWRVRGLTVAGFGVVLLATYLLFADDLGWTTQLARFERQWELPVDLATAGRFPAAWLPQAVAVAAILSGLTTAWVSRER